MFVIKHCKTNKKQANDVRGQLEMLFAPESNTVFEHEDLAACRCILQADVSSSTEKDLATALQLSADASHPIAAALMMFPHGRSIVDAASKIRVLICQKQSAADDMTQLVDSLSAACANDDDVECGMIEKKLISMLAQLAQPVSEEIFREKKSLLVSKVTDFAMGHWMALKFWEDEMTPTAWNAEAAKLHRQAVHSQTFFIRIRVWGIQIKKAGMFLTHNNGCGNTNKKDRRCNRCSKR